MPSPLVFSPGMRLKIRDEEFALLHADPLMSGGYHLTCLGVSETVAGREYIFISGVEKPVVLRPEDTRLIADSSPQYRDSLLALETRLRSRVSSGTGLLMGHRAAMDMMDFQLEPARMALEQTRPRILIADTVGLGKTLEAGILVTELIARGRGKRILVVTVKSMLTQFQKEFWNRFTIPLVRMDSQGLARVRARIPRNHNPFDYIEKSIISVDTLKNGDEYRVYLERAFWDIIIIDEAHHVSFKGTRTLSFRLAGLLGSRSDSLILLSATPHNGKPESFASLMKMLDPTSIADARSYTPEDIRGLFIRRFRKDVVHQMRSGLPERRVMTWDCRADPSEEAAYAALCALDLKAVDRTQKRNGAQLALGQMLKTVSLKKAILSSPAACRAQTATMLQGLAGDTGPEAASDRAQLLDLQGKVEAIGKAGFSKYRHLVAMLREEWRWSGKDSEDRLVIFTERLETLRFLAQHLASDLKLPETAVKSMSGAMGDVEIQELVEEFGKERSGIRILIASDVASEGLNLHFQAHRLVHFDIPWSLMVFQQRNGRIDRYGQTREPLIAYLLTRYEADARGGDVRVLELLIEKEKAAWKNIGDPATIMGQFDPEKEELYTADLLLNPEFVAAFSAQTVEEAGGNDFLADLYATWDATTGEAETLADPGMPPAGGGVDPAGGKADRIGKGGKAGVVLPGAGDGTSDPAMAAEPTAPAYTGTFSLFPDYDYLVEGLLSLAGEDKDRLKLTENRAHQSLSFELDEDLESWLREQLPRELRPESSRLELIGDPRIMMARIRASQAEESAWPEADYLWSNHPVFTWLQDRLLARQGRLKAPVVYLPLPDEAVFIISSTHPNRRGRPVYQRLWAACIQSGEWRIENGEAWLAARNLATRRPVNDTRPRNASALERLLPQAVRLVHDSESGDFQTFRSAQKRDMDCRLRAMDRVRDRRTAQLELALASSNQPERLRLARLEEERDRITSTFREWSDWVRDSMSLEDRAHLQVLAVFARIESHTPE